MSTHTAPALPPEKGGQRGVIFAAIAIMVGMCACTSHTRYYTTDGTRVTEIERTTHIGATPVGATPPAPLVRGVQEDVPASTGPALPPDKGGPRGVLSTDSTRQDIP